MTLLKAIDTRYAGHLFRSRLEARWAVAFNELGLRWEYEPEGFDLPQSGPYLPDFLTTFPAWDGSTTKIWIEVKGTSPTVDEINKLRELCCLTGHHGYFAVGSQSLKSLATNSYDGNVCLGAQGLTNHQVPHSVFSPLAHGFDRSVIPQETRDAFFKELDSLLFAHDALGERPAIPFRRAARKALSARFEHGAKRGQN